MNRKLLAFTALLALFVIGLGAYVRLSDAGLGCPDWPGCYGHYLGVPSTPDEPAAAQATTSHIGPPRGARTPPPPYSRMMQTLEPRDRMACCEDHPRQTLSPENRSCARS